VSLRHLHHELHVLRDSPSATAGALLLLAAALVLLLRRRAPWRWALLALAVGVWVTFDGSVEGPTVLPFTRRHGLSAGDLVAAVAVAAGLLPAVRSRLRDGARPGDQDGGAVTSPAGPPAPRR
jgi:hypothetical protein